MDHVSVRKKQRDFFVQLMHMCVAYNNNNNQREQIQKWRVIYSMKSNI